MKRILLTLVCTSLLLAGCSAKNVESIPNQTAETPIETNLTETITEDLLINGFSSVNKSQEITLTAAPLDGGEDREFQLNDGEDQCALAEALMHYNSRLIFRVTYTGNAIDHYTILDVNSGEDLGMLDADGLYNAFDVRARFDCKDLDVSSTGMVFLSQLEEGVLYCCTVDEESGIRVDNDINVNAVVYCEDSEYAMPEYQYFFSKNISTPSNIDFSVFSNLVFIYFESYEDVDVAAHLPEEQFLPLSRYQQNETLELSFESCIWNDTDTLVSIKDSDGELVCEMDAGAIVGVDWMNPRVLILQ